MKVIWKEPATRRLTGIYRFIAENNLSAAVWIYDEIIDRADQLADFPEMVPVESSLAGEPENFRSLVVDGTYKVIYYPTKCWGPGFEPLRDHLNRVARYPVFLFPPL